MWSCSLDQIFDITDTITHISTCASCIKAFPFRPHRDVQYRSDRQAMNEKRKQSERKKESRITPSSYKIKRALEFLPA